MKKLITLFLLVTLVSNIAFADCDWNTGITPGPNKTFIYSEACHLAVGQLVQSNKTQLAEISDLTQAVQLKDAALLAADQRTMLWTKASDDELDRLNKLSADSKRNDWLMFGLGALTVIGSGFMAAKLIKN